jgi:hypothetical protein
MKHNGQINRLFGRDYHQQPKVHDRVYMSINSFITKAADLIESTPT